MCGNDEKTEEEIKWTPVAKESLPKWLTNSRYIFEWHRPPLPNYTTCLKSILRIHTETGNIWSHMLAIFLFLAILLRYLIKPVNHDLDDNLLVLFYVFSGMLCWIFSTCFHTFGCHSTFVRNKTERLDYCGILFYALSAFFPVIYYIFRCNRTLRYVYLTSLGAVSLVVLCLTQWEPFGRTKYRPIRAMVFSTLFLVTVLPFVHAFFKLGVGVAFDEQSLRFIFGFVGTASTGVLIYATEVPERIWPGKFDLFLHSHQIFHVFAVIAGIVHLYAIIALQEFHNNKACDVL